MADVHQRDSIGSRMRGFPPHLVESRDHEGCESEIIGKVLAGEQRAEIVGRKLALDPRQLVIDRVIMIDTRRKSGYREVDEIRLGRLQSVTARLGPAEAG